MFKLKYLIPFVVTMFISCAVELAGNGSEIVNGKLLSKTPGVLIEAVETQYIPQQQNSTGIIKTFTDKNGEFSLELDSGYYNIFIRDMFNGVGVVIPDVKNGEDLGVIDLYDLVNIDVNISLSKRGTSASP
ncbi:MAG: hypothetical protein Q4F84_03180, partial [Fibrobacter sp.]|nr:hypothetical protein [Fibrobacter sp.]